jgi:hypothetical protein
MPTGSFENPSPSPLQRRLFEPTETLPLDNLADRWFRQTIVLRCAGQARAVGDPRLPGWLRGGFGQALMRGASAAALADRPCNFSPPCALDVLFRSQGRLRRDLDMPPPYVLTVGEDGDDTLLRLTVFGFACDWIDAAAEAFTVAARGTSPPGLRGSRLEPTDRAVQTAERVAIGGQPERVILEFVSPVTFRDHKGVAYSSRRLLMAMVSRVTALARFQDCDVAGDWAELARRAEDVRLDGSDLRWVDWEQGSSRNGGRKRPMEGQIGHVVLSGQLAAFLTPISLASTCHVGSHAALGQGAFRVIGVHKE